MELHHGEHGEHDGADPEDARGNDERLGRLHARVRDHLGHRRPRGRGSRPVRRGRLQRAQLPHRRRITRQRAQRRRRRPPGAESGDGDHPRPVRLWHFRGDDGRYRTGSPRAVRARLARIEPRGRRREHRGDVERAQHRVLRHEVGRLQRGRRTHRGRRARRHVAVPDVRRSDDARVPEPARARPVDARRHRSDHQPRFRPSRRHPADRQQHAGLRRQQSGRHHGNGARRNLTGLRPGRARCGRHELLDPAAAFRRLRHLRGDLHPGVPQRARPHAAAVGHPDAVGPHRGGGVRPSPRRRSTARHAREDGADACRVRRLAGQRADGHDRRAHDGRADPPARSPPTVAVGRSNPAGVSTRSPTPPMDRAW